MIQEIAVIVIIVLAVAYFVWKIYKSFFKKGGSPCDSCTGSCELKSRIKDCNK